MGECLLVRRGGETKKLPVLALDYPKNMTVWGDGGSATFQVVIATEGYPKDYTYEWYRDGTLASWATGPTCTFYNLSQAKTYSVYCVVTNKAGSVTSRTAQLTVKNPNVAYTYISGEHEFINDGDDNWRIKFKSSGILKFTSLGKWDGLIDVFCVGGGGGGGTLPTYADHSGGGGGGYTKTQRTIQILTATDYSIEIGAGGAGTVSGFDSGKSGGASSAFGVSAAGGKGNDGRNGGAGGSGGGGGARVSKDQDDKTNRLGKGGNGGSDGTNGSSGTEGYGGMNGSGGAGQGTTTREFGETTGTLYSGGGGGAGHNYSGTGGDGGGGAAHAYNVKGESGTANLGGGGGAGRAGGGDGGSGIVIIRNARNDSITITQQPQDAEVALNANAVFTVAATGTGLTYQWQFSVPTDTTAWSNTSISGYNTATLTVQALAYRANYRYRCVITDANGIKAVSSPATLTIVG